MRRKGAGRPEVEKRYPDIGAKIKELLETNACGDQEPALTWTNLSLREITRLLATKYSIRTGRNTVSDALSELGYCRHANHKADRSGDPHSDRDSQFRLINQKALEFISRGLPVICVDTGKTELTGNFQSPGARRRSGNLQDEVSDHDFPPEGVRASPNGVYVVNASAAYASLGTGGDTGSFAAESIRSWWNVVGKSTFPEARKLYVNCDINSDTGIGTRLWKYEQAMLAQETGLEIHVSHFPPVTSRWNKVEHRLFCFTTRNWQGKPLIDVQATVKLIGSAKTEIGPKVLPETDYNACQNETKIQEETFEKIAIVRDRASPRWNYTVAGFIRLT